jgi:hypothetical protein
MAAARDSRDTATSVVQSPAANEGSGARNDALQAAGAQQISANLDDSKESTWARLGDLRRSITGISFAEVEEVAGETAHEVWDHIGSIAGVTAAFLGAEALAMALSSTGIGAAGAAFIEYALAAWGGVYAAEAIYAAGAHVDRWFKTAWHANGDPGQMQAARIEFIRMAESIALAALSTAGVRANVKRGTGFMDSFGDGKGVGPAELPPRTQTGEPGPNNWEPLGRGVQSHARAYGDQVVKRARKYQDGTEISMDRRVAMTEIQTKLSECGHRVLGDLVPVQRVAREGTAISIQDRVGGVSLEALPEDLQEAAEAEFTATKKRLEAGIYRELPPSDPRFDWHIDGNPANARFTPEGKLLAWIDPFYVTDREAQKVSKFARPTDRPGNPAERLGGTAATTSAGMAGSDLDDRSNSED